MGLMIITEPPVLKATKELLNPRRMRQASAHPNSSRLLESIKNTLKTPRRSAPNSWEANTLSQPQIL